MSSECALLRIKAPIPVVSCVFHTAGRLPEEWVRVYSAEMGLALEHIHAQAVIHPWPRDRRKPRLTHAPYYLTNLFMSISNTM